MTPLEARVASRAMRYIGCEAMDVEDAIARAKQDFNAGPHMPEENVRNCIAITTGILPPK